MKKWVLLNIALYMLAIIVLSAPLFALAFIGGNVELGRIYQEFLSSGWFWLIFAVLVASQILLLTARVKHEGELVIKRHNLFLMVISASFLCMLLTGGIIFSLIAVFFGDHDSRAVSWGAVVLIFCSWIFWFVKFWKFGKNKPDKFFDKTIANLFKGSVLELLIVISSHILVRWRGDCCSPALTFGGIVAGVAVMLLAFGPLAIIVLMRKRRQKMLAKSKRNPSYNFGGNRQ
jgi:hypothetical protein